MSSQPPGQDEQVEAVKTALSEMGALSVLFGQAVADQAGMHPTDLESLDILRRQGPMTAGRLAELTGLSTGGAITALIDRLERLGYARRERDTSDRRRVLVRALPERAERELAPLYAPLDRAMTDLITRHSAVELELILSFMNQTNAVMQAQIL